MTHLILPWPPSANRLWRNVRGRVLISAAGRAHHSAVARVVASARHGGLGGHPPMEGRLSVTLDLTPPDRRRRDIDNTIKATLDACTRAGLWLDDAQIDRLLVVRGPVAHNAGCVAMRVETYT